MATCESGMETENLIETNVQQLDVEVCVKNEQEMKVENPEDSYGLHTDMCVKNEQDTDTESLIDLYVQQHGGDATIIDTTDIKVKTESAEPEALLHPQFHGVNVKREVEQIKTDIWEIAETSSLETQSQREELCHVNKSDVDCELGNDGSVLSLQTDTGRQMTNSFVDTGQIASDSRNSGTDDPRQSNMRAQVLGLLEAYGFVSVATDSAVDEILGTLMNKTLETTDQLRGVPGINTDGFPCTRCNSAFPTEALLEHHSAWLHHDESWRKTRELSGVSSHSRDGEKPAIDITHILKGGAEEIDEGDTCLNTDSMQDLSGKEDGGRKSRQTEHTCKVCGKSFIDDKSNFLKHIRTAHYFDKPHKCTVCCKTFARDCYLETHITTVHNNVTAYQCDVCSQAFGQRSQLQRHLRTIHGGDKPHKCTTCPEAFRLIWHLKTHLREVHERKGEKRDNPHKCTICGKTFCANSILRTHLRTVHDKDKPYKCAVCCKAFGESSTLKTHIRTVHNGDKPYECTACGKAFGLKTGLRKHRRVVHDGVKPYKCAVCAKVFGESGTLRKHMTAVHEKKKGSEFRNGDEDKPYKCTVCSKVFGLRQNRQKHIRTVHDGDKPHTCTVCSKAFGEKQAMQKHMRTVHHKEKPYKCTVCSKAFGRSSNMQTHMRTVHLKDKPYKCTVCCKAFGRSGILRQHLRAVHNVNVLDRLQKGVR